MKPTRGQNKLFSKCILFNNVTVALRLDNSKFKRPSLKDMLSNYCLNFNSAMIDLRVTQIRVLLLRSYSFLGTYSDFNGIYLYKLFAIFLPNPWIFSDILVAYSGLMYNR